MSLKIYFAGPNVFHPRAKEMELATIELCETMGITALIPGDSGIDWSAPQEVIAKEIFEINRDHLDNCDGVIANVTPFRGACVDDGTAWEIGYAHALKLPIVTYGMGGKTTSEIITAVSGVNPQYENPRRDSNDFLIEEFGLQNNLMISCSTLKHFHYECDIYEDISAVLKESLTFINSL